MKPLDRKVIRDVLHMRGQMLAIAVVVACGVALFVTMRGMHGHLRQSQQEYYSEYRFADLFARVERAPLSLIDRLRTVPGIASLEVRVVFDVLVDVPGLREPATGRLISIPAEGQPAMNALHLRSGRWPSRAARGEVLASDVFAAANDLGIGSTVGAVINGRWQTLRITGTALSPEYVYEISGTGDLFPDNRRFGVLWIPEGALAAAFDMEGAFNDLTARLQPGASAQATIDALDRLLEPYGGAGAHGRDEHVSHRFVEDEITETQVTSTLLPAIFLGITAFLLHTVLSRLVATQREQIGLLKAFGYASRRIGLHYIEMALVPVVAGAFVGSALGLWWAIELARVYARFFNFPAIDYRPDPAIVAQGVLIAVAVSLGGAWGAVRRASRMPPAEAMRPPTPPAFRPGPLERLGLGEWVSPGTRVVVRNLERAPVRTAFAALGISFSFAMVLVGLFMFDAIDFMKQLQFFMVQREDVTVTFVEPRGSRAEESLRSLPGVVDVESFRAVPVVLRSQHRSRRTMLLGLEPDAQLHRIVDSDLRVHRARSDGVSITSVLARDLGLSIGDTVEVEVREGSRPRFVLPVSDVVNEVVGTAAYLDRRYLNRLLQEGATISGAFLSTAQGADDELYAHLKRTPAVAGVAVRRATLDSFESTIAENFYISLGSMVGFACVIAIGIVYNGARIALSERGRELASLRVLGYTRGEVASMLMLEQAIVTALAVVPGIGIGVGLAALVTWRMQMELFRVPLVIEPRTFVITLVIVAIAAIVSATAVRRRLDRANLIAVLKTRE